MARRLYPLNALRAFEAAGRHLSFVKAAGELHVTPGAISHQVKGLEEFLRARLFHRLPRRVLLTDVGQNFLAELRECFARLDRAVEQPSAMASRVLASMLMPSRALKSPK